MQSTFILPQCQLKCFAVISSSYFPVINSVSNRISSLPVLNPIICFLGRFIWSKSPLLSLRGLIFKPSMYNKNNCHHPIPHHFLSITILSCESPSRVWPIHFIFSVLLCARINLFFSNTFHHFFMCLKFRLTDFPYSTPWPHFKVFSFPLFH